MTQTTEPAAADQATDRGSVLHRFAYGVRQLFEVKPGTPWHRNPRLGLGMVLASTVITLFVGFLGPSVTTLNIGPRSSILPPWYLPGGVLKPNPWLVVMLCYLLLFLGAAGTFICLRALAVGWKPRNRNLYILGVVVNLITITVPPQTSADVLMYAGYGRLTKLGYDAYSVAPAEIFRQMYDPIIRWTEKPWQDMVNVYGPLLYGMQYVANVLGGENLHDVVFWLQLFCCVAFIAACTVIIWMARGNNALQRRAIIWTLLNPMMIWAVVTGAHNEAVSIAVALAGFLFIRRNPFLTGLLIGVACTGKATVGLYGVAMAWAYRRELKKFLLSMLGAAIPNTIVYIFLFPRALELASKNASYVIGSSWISPVRRVLNVFISPDAVSVVVSVLAWGSAVMLGWMLSRVLPWRALPGAPPGTSPERDPLVIALRTTVVMAVGWVITSAYSLAWYDLIYFLPMALLGATQLDVIALLRAGVLNVAFVLGRVIDYTPLMAAWNQRVREIITPTVGVGVIVVVVLWWHEHGLKVGSHTRAPHAGDETSGPPGGEETDEPARTTG
ncbi:hypothetical protein CGZ93_00550 [Enemella dayhoffiae]|uniref:DUF2029 domain-containing protein n=1 Tax=Enemella dayhoffiae TaxID=2016507 RepID=A0A255HBP5_9ACTN|nr:polyprenol phosphomannose-dependent alpha 1,6 mannosyltransferase MptB [Enemella dayhoffiae]OYO24995.1 hypothetical protein CGZ93_00550 [Enemella dayhoffiae]